MDEYRDELQVNWSEQRIDRPLGDQWLSAGAVTVRVGVRSPLTD